MRIKLQIKKIIEQSKLKQTEKELREIINNNFLLKMIPYKFAKIIDIQEVYKACIDSVNQVNTSLEQVQKNQFIQTCDEDQLTLYENILKINNKNEDIEIRRGRILSIYSNILPFTLVTLIENLNNILGYNNYKLTVYYTKYQLQIELFEYNSSIEKILAILLIPMLPAHIYWYLLRNINIEKSGDIYIDGCIYQKNHIIIKEM